MTGRDLGHVITWDFLIFLLKLDIWLINSWYFSIPGTGRLHITVINQSNQPKWIPGIDLGRSPGNVGKVEHYARPASTQLSANSTGVMLNCRPSWLLLYLSGATWFLIRRLLLRIFQLGYFCFNLLLTGIVHPQTLLTWHSFAWTQFCCT